MININELTKLLKQDLKVSPKVKLSDKNYYSSVENTIYYKYHENDLDLIFNIAHEFRHCYQFKHNKSILNNYKAREELDLKDYNLQPAELDAHAYAWHFINKFVDPNIKPLFNGFDEDIVKKIEEVKSTLE